MFNTKFAFLFLPLAPVFAMENICLDPHPTQPSVRINDYQILATHNSYHKILPGNVVPELNYDPGTLSDQLSMGVRSFELDVYYHLNTSSYDVLHVPTLDDNSHCNTLEECFDQVNEWKTASKSIWHVPIFYMIEFKGLLVESNAHQPDDCVLSDIEDIYRCAVDECGDKGYNFSLLMPCIISKCLQKMPTKGSCLTLFGCVQAEFGNYGQTNEFTGDQISSSMEACVTSTETKTRFLDLPEDQGTLIEGLEKIVVEKISSKSLITPVDVIKRDDGTYKWPLIDKSRGKSLVYISESPQSYTSNILFFDNKDSYITNINSVTDDGNEEKVKQAIENGSVVRSRADTVLINDPIRREMTITYGSQILTTDHISEWTSYGIGGEGDPVKCKDCFGEDPDLINSCFSKSPTTKVGKIGKVAKSGKVLNTSKVLKVKTGKVPKVKII